MNYSSLLQERDNAYQKAKQALFTSHTLPKQPLPVHFIERILLDLSSADYNQFQSSGAGEREGRVFSSLVSRSHFGFAHGIGRSGDLVEDQPKAAGSSLLHRITRGMALNAVQLCGFQAKGLIVAPFCVGMSVNFVVQSLGVKRVAWVRMDQKSVPKALELAGVEIVVVEVVLVDNYVTGDLEELERVIESVDCVISTTSCFSPRQPDNIQKICQIVGKHKKLHIVNNAYGIHSDVMKQLNKYPSINFVVSSLDKNFMVPVGGCLIYSKYSDQIEALAKSYAGRASGSSVIDLFITLLEMGQTGMKQLQVERKRLFEMFIQKLGEIPQISVNQVAGNDISFYYLFKDQKKYPAKEVASFLFRSGISGSKALVKGKTEKFKTFNLEDFGRGGVTDLPDYITCAVGIGMQEFEINNYVSKLKSIIKQFE